MANTETYSTTNSCTTYESRHLQSISNAHRQCGQNLRRCISMAIFNLRYRTLYCFSPNSCRKSYPVSPLQLMYSEQKLIKVVEIALFTAQRNPYLYPQQQFMRDNPANILIIEIRLNSPLPPAPLRPPSQSISTLPRIPILTSLPSVRFLMT